MACLMIARVVFVPKVKFVLQQRQEACDQGPWGLGSYYPRALVRVRAPSLTHTC